MSDIIGSVGFWIGAAASLVLNIASSFMHGALRDRLTQRQAKAMAIREKATQKRLARLADATSDAEYRHHLEQRALERLVSIEGDYTRADTLVWTSLVLIFVLAGAGMPTPILWAAAALSVCAAVFSFVAGKARREIWREQDDLATARLDTLDARDSATDHRPERTT